MHLQHKFSFFFLLVLSLAISSKVTAQSKVETFTAKNAVYLEIGGNAGQYAFTYGRLFYQAGAFKLTGSAGISLWADRVEGSTVFNPAVPLEVSGIIGSGNHHLELGLGVTPHLATSLDFNPETLELEDKVVFGSLIPLRIGYRYQKPEGGFFFRVGYTPFFTVPVGDREDWVFTPIFAGLSFGKSF
ncbi:hypothetical protein [Algoriphagus sp.]|uniref:hypothetical protein n=1 Tax=Algoriphagus sp. TaxID=1872435 RepID=UPI003F7078DA